MMKKILSLVLAVALLFGNVNYAFAAEGTTVEPSIEASIAELQGTLAELKTALEEALAYEETVDANIAELESQIAATTAQLKEAKDALATKKASVPSVKVTNSKTTIKVSWEKVDTADRYQVVLFRNGKKFATKYTNDLTISWKNQARGVYYKAKVTPFAKYEGKNYYGIGKTSKPMFLKLKHVKPVLKITKSGKNQKLKAGDLNSTGYQVKIAKNKKFTKGVKTYKFYTAFGALNKNLKTSKYFSNGRKYVKVRPYTTINGKTYYGKWSAVKVKK